LPPREEGPDSFSDIDVVLELDAKYLAEAKAGPQTDPAIPLAAAETVPAQIQGGEAAKPSIACYYYLVNHKDRTIFWLDEFHYKSLHVWGIMGVTEMAHLRQSLHLSV
jgi:hypothetical protein